MYNSFYNAYSYCINNAKENEQNKKLDEYYQKNPQYNNTDPPPVR